MHSSNDRLKMIVADGSSLVRAGIRRMLNDAPEIEIVDECADAKTTIAAIRNLEPDFVMLDFYLECGTAVDVLRECRLMHRRPVCIVHTQNTEPSIRAISYAAGADVVYDKGREVAPLLTMLRKVAIALLKPEVAA